MRYYVCITDIEDNEIEKFETNSKTKAELMFCEYTAKCMANRDKLFCTGIYKLARKKYTLWAQWPDNPKAMENIRGKK